MKASYSLYFRSFLCVLTPERWLNDWNCPRWLKNWGLSNTTSSGGLKQHSIPGLVHRRFGTTTINRTWILEKLQWIEYLALQSTVYLLEALLPVANVEEDPWTSRVDVAQHLALVLAMPYRLVVQVKHPTESRTKKTTERRSNIQIYHDQV